MSRRTQRAVVALCTAAVASALLAACSANSQPVGQPSPTFNSGVGVMPGMRGTGAMPGMGSMPMTPSPTDGAAPTISAAPAANAVNIDNFAFVPATLTIKAGSTVTWTNKDEDPHTVVADGGTFRSQALSSGGTYSFTFPAAGTFDYVCSVHPFMHGSVEVTA
ncbi:MAG TPA: cupredoxin family copper-binding protein [Mycobacterium sp.]|nr:cupredoxin family copper-binding protein [Mycobacterium sp.]